MKPPVGDLPRDQLEGGLTDDTLDVGEEMEFEFRYEAVAAGDATITCHIRPTIDADDVFPRSAGADGRKTLTVRP
jgi:hypothetical protein